MTERIADSSERGGGPGAAADPRAFLGWDEPALPAAVRRLADAHAAPDGPSLGEALVVLPGRRAGRRLVELVLEEGERRGEALPPPGTVTVGALPERLLRAERPPAGRTLSTRVWARSLAELEPGRLEEVFPRPPGPDDLPGWSRLAEVVRGLYRDVAGEGLDFADVADACADAGRPAEARRWRALSAARTGYLRRLEELGRADRHHARVRALEEGRVASDRPVWLLGVVELPGIVRRMLEAVEGPVRALVHAPAALADAFDRLGTVRPAAWVDREPELSDADLDVRRGPAGQADAAVQALSGDGPALAPDQVTVGVPDDEVVPYLEHRLDARGVPHRVAAGTPMEQTRPHRLLAAVADYLDGRRYRDLAALVRHPDVERRLDAGDPAGTVDRYFEDHLPRRADRAPLPRSPHRDDLQAVLDAVDGRLGLASLEGERPTGRWMPEVLALLERVYGDRPLEAGDPAHRRLAEACEELRDAAEEMHGLPTAADREAPAAAAIRLLLARVREEEIPPEPRRPAVEMLGWLELHLDDAPVLVLTGMSDEEVPGAAGADPFLPDRLRRRLGLPDDRSRHGRDAYLMAAALRPRRERTVVVGRVDAEGDPLRPSRLLLALSGEALARRVRRLFGDRPPSAADRDRVGPPPAGESRFRSPPEPEIRVSAVPDELRVTDFRNLLEDPYRFALERLRGLREQHDRSRELGGRAFGGLAHRVLHAFGQSREAGSPDPEEARRRLEELLRRAVRRRYGDDALPAVPIQVEQLRLRLRRFARWHAARVEAGWRVAATEVSPPGEGGVPFDVEGEPVRLRGRIDRIDRHADSGAFQLLDYKTGESPADPDRRHRAGRGADRRWVDLQLPLYRHLAPGVAEAPGVPSGLRRADATLELGYVNVSKEGVELALAGWSEDELREADAAARRAVARLREGVIRHRPGEGRSLRDDPLAPLFAGRDRAAADAGGGESP